ncbi:MAG: hypothetical protein ACJ75F_10175 [Flavisolibacter sp.]|jgi:predicted dehydrogenase
MNSIKNIAVIGCQLSEEFFTASRMNDEKFHLKKLFFGEQLMPQSVQSQFPHSEIVNDVSSIASDDSIELVIVASDHLKYAKEAMASGKAVRVI